MSDEFELYVEVDGVPLLQYPDAEGDKAYVCSVEDRAYVPHFVNHLIEVVSVKFAIDSKTQPGWKTAHPSRPRRLRTAVAVNEAEDAYAEFRFAANPPPSVNADALLPAENLERFGRIDAEVVGSTYTGSVPFRARGHRLEDIAPEAAVVPQAKRKVGASTTRVSVGAAKAPRGGMSSEYTADPHDKIASLTLFYRPARLLRLYGLVGIQPQGMQWAEWLRGFQFPRVPSLQPPAAPLQRPRVQTPRRFLVPSVAEVQAVVRTDAHATKGQWETYAAQNGLSAQPECETLPAALASLVWGDAACAEAVDHCVRYQRQGQHRHYAALGSAAGWADDATYLKAFSDFFQVPVVLHTPTAEPPVQALVSPLMQEPHRCYALGRLPSGWLPLTGSGVEEDKKAEVVVIEID